MAQSITATQLRSRLSAGEDLVLLDVREPEEFAIGHIEGSLHIPMGDLAVRHTELDPERATVCICHHGIRSASVVAALEAFDFRELYNLTGGLERWSLEVDPSLPRY